MTRVAVVGCSNLGKVHIRNYLAADGVELVAICDLLEGPRRVIQDEILTPKGLEPAQYDDYETMLDECELDGVSLIVPHSLHFSMCRQALEAGVNVLVEKPM
ncbi:MAG: Gfo/Idh/MocA family oxidoreductase, partial [Phycisphaeraceae bacterium]|nr:Gfo/Idh/MocA family oxidoreductase [Phycisphaeraceae bacterium]